MAELSSGYQAEIETALETALPTKFHPSIPVLAHVLVAARDGTDASVATEGLLEALRQLQGTTLDVQSGNITVGNISGEGIAIGHGAQSTVIRIYVPRTAEQKREWRNRSRMLEKVRTYWVEGFLQQSLHKIALIELGMMYHPDALAQPWEMIVQFPDRPRESVPPGTSIVEVFDEFSGELLILGSPGTGKTTMLLELTRTLIERAQQDETRAMPVVFNLSSWAVKRPPLTAWLAEELNIRYDVPRKVAKAWIAEGQVLPLLDGLDEVAATHRTACVEAINVFRGEQGQVEMVVCSRIADYEVLTQKLRLQGAVLLQLLTTQQIEDVLRQIGDQAEVVRTVLQCLHANAQQYDDRAAEELTRTPLLLSITALAYYDDAASELPPRDAPPAAQQRHLFATYVERMFKRRGQSTRYTSEQTRHWLTWLAGRMVREGLTVFFIERMQPPWIKWWQWQRLAYFLVGLIISMLGSGLLNFILSGGGMVFGVFSDDDTWLDPIDTLIMGAFIGAFFPLAASLAQQWMTIKPVEALSWSPKKVVRVFRYKLKENHKNIVLLSVMSLWFFLFIAFLEAMQKPFVGTDPMELQALIVGAVAETILMSMFFACLFVVITFVTALFDFVGNELPETVYPNQGMWRSSVNGLIAWTTIIILWLTLQITFEIWIFENMSSFNISVAQWVWAVFYIGWLIGLPFGFSYGGLAVLQHLSLRITLLLNPGIPLTLPRFLNYATERIFLRKVGGGYIFVHRLLMEYFASLESDSKESSS